MPCFFGFFFPFFVNKRSRKELIQFTILGTGTCLEFIQVLASDHSLVGTQQVGVSGTGSLFGIQVRALVYTASTSLNNERSLDSETHVGV